MSVTDLLIRGTYPFPFDPDGRNLPCGLMCRFVKNDFIKMINNMWN